MKKIFFAVCIFWILTFLYQGAFAMEITSTAFSNNSMIPDKYGCNFENISPPLAWNAAPKATKTFALIVHDPDAPRGNWTHWVLYNIPATTNSLPENASMLPPGTKVGANSWPRARYDGPCPPTGTHRYIFTIYALDTILNLKDKATSDELVSAMQGHVVATAELMGKFQHR